MRLFSLILTSFLFACDGDKPDSGDTGTSPDIDGDGWTTAQGDCDDGDATVYPDAAEVWYDDVDQNCDGLSDFDQDADGSEQGEDCDDADPEVSPTATEVCNETDDDCDGEVDEEGDVLAYIDADGDGYGTGDSVGTYCDLPEGTAATDDDCNDGDAAVSPAAEEVCDGVDNNCDGDTDIGATDGTTFYTDADLDGYGDDATGVSACDPVEGTVEVAGDCDDADSATYPGAVELCDLNDNDCDGSVDEDATEPRTYYADADGDTYGDPAVTTESCGAPSGYVEDNTDCDDVDAAINPGADEICDGLDSNCNGSIDDSPVDGTAYYADSDGDLYGSATAEMLCADTSGYVTDNTDCDDSASSVNPGASEVCDGIDNNCDGATDDGTATDADMWYIDADTDGYGDTSGGSASCTEPAGFVANDEDCNDTVATINPDADEVCDSLDNDCDGTVDSGALDATAFYADADGDGYGDLSVVANECDQPTGYVTDATDCDDAASSSYPGAVEICDGEDQDCDGTVDDDAADGTTLYADTDGDGFGDAASTTIACEEGGGWVADDTDCDDGEVSVNPDASELCDGIDNNCDSSTDGADSVDASSWYTDADSDGYGNASLVTLACTAPSGSVANDTDCDDSDDSSYPGGTEMCDSADNDCDGTVDESSADATTWYRDADADTYGNSAVTQAACDQPTGYVSNSTDCNDTTSSASPADTEACDGIDNDCDSSVDESGASGESTWYIDADGDAHGIPDTTLDACDLPTGYAALDDDCDDADASSYPTATESQDVVDNDCDGFVDEDFITAGSLVITEIDRQPRVGGSSTNTDALWFEVHNPGSIDVDMSDWYVRRYSSTVAEDGFYVDPVDGVIVSAGSYATFCKTDDYAAVSTSYSTLVCDYYWGDETAASTYAGTYHDNTFNFQRDSDSVSLYISGDDATGTLVDTVAWYYDATNGYWPRDASRSTQLSLDALDDISNDDIDSWCSVTNNAYFQWYYVSSSVREYGTPGIANHDCP